MNSSAVCVCGKSSGDCFCDICGRPNHDECGITVRKQFSAFSRCPSCDKKAKNPKKRQRKAKKRKSKNAAPKKKRKVETDEDKSFEIDCESESDKDNTNEKILEGQRNSASCWKYLPTSVHLRNMDKIQQKLNDRLSPTAQLCFAMHFRANILSQPEKFLFPAGSSNVHWKDVAKLFLYKITFDKSHRDLAEMVFDSVSKQSTIGVLFKWARHKAFDFFKPYIIPFDLKTRLELAKEFQTQQNYFLTGGVDGTHIRIAANLIDWDGQKTAYDFRSPKQNTRAKYCVNVVVWNLANGFTAHVSPPYPAKDNTDSVIVSKKECVKALGKAFTVTDGFIGDGGFSVFTASGSKSTLLKPKIFTRETKEKGRKSLPCISKAISDQLSSDRNKITEHKFGYVKQRFECLKAGLPTGKKKWVQDIIFLCFSLNNIHCYEKLLEKHDVLKPVKDFSHPFFDTNYTNMEDLPSSLEIATSFNNTVSPKQMINVTAMKKHEEDVRKSMETLGILIPSPSKLLPLTMGTDLSPIQIVSQNSTPVPKQLFPTVESCSPLSKEEEFAQISNSKLQLQKRKSIPSLLSKDYDMDVENNSKVSYNFAFPWNDNACFFDAFFAGVFACLGKPQLPECNNNELQDILNKIHSNQMSKIDAIKYFDENYKKISLPMLKDSNPENYMLFAMALAEEIGPVPQLRNFLRKIFVLFGMSGGSNNVSTCTAFLTPFASKKSIFTTICSSNGTCPNCNQVQYVRNHVFIVIHKQMNSLQEGISNYFQNYEFLCPNIIYEEEVILTNPPVSFGSCSTVLTNTKLEIQWPKILVVTPSEQVNMKQVIENEIIFLNDDNGNVATFYLKARTIYRNRNHFVGYYYVSGNWVYYDDMEGATLLEELPHVKLNQKNQYSLWLYCRQEK